MLRTARGPDCHLFRGYRGGMRRWERFAMYLLAELF
jgi:hypothetical protein